MLSPFRAAKEALKRCFREAKGDHSEPLTVTETNVTKGSPLMATRSVPQQDLRQLQSHVAGLIAAAIVVLASSALLADESQRAGDSFQDLKANWRKVPSKVVGSPEPPPPYRVSRTLPKLSLTNPIVVVTEPATKRLWFIDHDPEKKQSRLCRTTEDPASGDFETLLDFGKAVAYSIAFHPQFSENGFVFIGLHDPITGEGRAKHVGVTRYTVDRKTPHQILPDTSQSIIEWESNGHNGAAVAFGQDGMLYITSGDGTSDSDTNLTGQGLDHLLAKVLRIDVDKPSDGLPYSIPADNPFVDMKDTRPETWAYGFRNPWRMSVDPRTGQLWVGNNGQDLWEQIYLVERGANYGWSVYEGGHIFYANRKLGPTPVSKPIFDHPHSEARSMTGGVVYYGSKFPDLQGAYIYGDYSTGKIWGAKVNGREVLWHRELADTPLAIAAFGIDGDGELLIVDYQGNQKGGFYTFETNDTPDTSSSFPRLLSQTGLFTTVRDHQVAPGLIPYSVNAELWSDGAYKQRYIYLPPTTGEGDDAKPSRIAMAGRGWDFPERTVLVKSFALETQPGETASRKWIETRLLTKTQGEWVGYAYAWNDEQTEATLVAREGRDRPLEWVGDDNAGQPRSWHFPSRSECMVCHSRAAKYVLGPSTLQMNKDHDYGGTKANQLELLHYLGVLQVAWSAEAKKKVREQLETTGLKGKELAARVREVTSAGSGGTSPLALDVHWSEGFPRLADPYDKTEDLTARARSYLHANCAQCHVEAGGGNSQLSFEFTKALADAKLIGETPLHDKYDIPDAKIIAAGDPDRSVLLHRIALRGRGQMPQLATSVVDERAVELVREWIRQLK